MLSILMEMRDKRIYVIVVYWVLGLLNNFIEGLIKNMKDFITSNMRIVLVEDSNVD